MPVWPNGRRRTAATALETGFRSGHIACLAAAPAAAQPGGVLDFPVGAHADRDGFSVAIVTTANIEAFTSAFVEGGERLRSTITQRAVRGEELRTLILFDGCRPAADGKCNVTGHFTYLAPDGSTYGTIDSDIWDEAPNPPGVLVGLGPILVVDPPDPMGRWTLRAEIRDNVRGVTVTVQTPIEVDTPPVTAR